MTTTRINVRAYAGAALAALLAAPFAAHAAWPAQFGGTGSDVVRHVETAPNGDVFVAGTFEGTMRLVVAGELTTLTARGAADVFVARLDSSGQVRWARAAGGPGNDTLDVLAIDRGDQPAVYLGGTFDGASFRASGVDLANQGAIDGYVAKYDSYLDEEQQFAWLRQVSSPVRDRVVGVASLGDLGNDLEASVMVVGDAGCLPTFVNPTDAGNTTQPAAGCTPGETVVFGARIDGAGDWQTPVLNPAVAGMTVERAVLDPVERILHVVARESQAPQVAYSSAFASGWTPASEGYDSVGSFGDGVAIAYQANYPNHPGYAGAVRLSAGSNNQFVESSAALGMPPLHDNAAFGELRLRIRLFAGGDDGADSNKPEATESFQVYWDTNAAAGTSLATLVPGDLGPYHATRTLEYVLRRTDHPSAFVAGGHTRFRVKTRGFTNSGSGDSTNSMVGKNDSWFIEQVELLRVPTQSSQVLFAMSGLTGTPAFGPSHAMDPDLYVKDAVLRSGRLYLLGAPDVGTPSPPGDVLCPLDALDRSSFAILNLDVAGATPSCRGVVGGASDGVHGASPLGLAIDGQGRLYTTGFFNGTHTFGTQALASAGAVDAYIASLDTTDDVLSWRWATGGGDIDPTGIPDRAGGPENDVGHGLAVVNDSGLAVGGSFRGTAEFGPDALTALGTQSDGVVFTLGTDGRFPRVQEWVVGVPVPAPPGAELDAQALQPTFRVLGAPVDALGQGLFLWTRNAAGKFELIPLQNTSAIEVRWQVDTPNDDPLDQGEIPILGRAAWPAAACTDDALSGCYQVHIAGAPVDVRATDADFATHNAELKLPSGATTDATLETTIFNASVPGHVVLVYRDIAGTPARPASVQVVRTFAYPESPQFEPDLPATVGIALDHAYHTEADRTGYVLNEKAYYDGANPDSAYSRATRTGRIIPVNVFRPGRPRSSGRELAVAWYRANRVGAYWPSKAASYDVAWPSGPDLRRIVIASELGSELGTQPSLDPAVYPGGTLYVQNDPQRAGFNPNDEHALLAGSNESSGIPALFALRSDFGSGIAGDGSSLSDPYVLYRYLDAATSEPRFLVYRVVATEAPYTSFTIDAVAGNPIAAPYPVRLLGNCPGTVIVGQAANGPPPTPFHRDYKAQLYAKSAGTGTIRYHYRARDNFFTADAQGDNLLAAGTCTPWLPRLDATPDPIDVVYDVAWPAAPRLVSGETLLTPKNGLPNIVNQSAVEVVYDEVRDQSGSPGTAAQLISPLSERYVNLKVLPDALATELLGDGRRTITGSSDGTLKLPVSIRKRLRYDPTSKRLALAGSIEQPAIGEPVVLLNVLSQLDRDALKQLDGGSGGSPAGAAPSCVPPAGGSEIPDCTWDEAVEALFRLSRNPQRIARICTATTTVDNVLTCSASREIGAEDVLIGAQDENGDFILEPYQSQGAGAALSAGFSQGSGYVTLAFNDDPSLNPAPVSLAVIRVDCLAGVPPATAGTYQGQIHVIAPDNVFDEQVVLRHSGDFGGNPDALDFEWYYAEVVGNGAATYPPGAPEWTRVAQGRGLVELTISGANERTLSDGLYYARYRGLGTCGNAAPAGDFSLLAGAPGGGLPDPALATRLRPQLAEGWVKRVLARLNPFEARVQDFGQAETNTYASMLVQLGGRYEGPIALVSDPDNLNSVGLIEAYTTVLRRAMDLSINNGTFQHEPSSIAILLVASRLAEFYTLLGNEAYADAQDPTIGITTGTNESFSLSPSIFNFQNQLDSLLSEELALLRGRDPSGGAVSAPPVYNRLVWNFTRGDGEVAYANSYNLTDQVVDGVIDENDARVLFPQGHGDAWGHYLTGTKIYYELLRHPNFTWIPRSEQVLVGGAPIAVDFLDERQFAETAAAKARAGAEIVDLTYRQAYVEDPAGQYQGYEDIERERAWGLSEWGRRAGQGAYFDWLTVNAIVPSSDPAHTGIAKIERRTVYELDEIASNYDAVQAQVDKADSGLNPLGLAKGVVPFDIDPAQLDRFNRTQFEQVYERAMVALRNARQVWNFANQLNNQLRRSQTSADALYEVTVDQETDFANQLIEIFGYPYADDIGAGGLYPDGYDGPDLYHYNVVDVPALAGTALDFTGSGVTGDAPIAIRKIEQFNGVYKESPNGVRYFEIEPLQGTRNRRGANGEECRAQPFAAGCPLGERPDDRSLNVSHHSFESPDTGVWFTKDPSWTGQRRAPGRIQQTIQQMLQARISLKQGLLDYDRLRGDIAAQAQTIQATFNTNEANLSIANRTTRSLQALNSVILGMNAAAAQLTLQADLISENFKDFKDCIPDSQIVGIAFGGDIFAGIRCALSGAGTSAIFIQRQVAVGLEVASNGLEIGKEAISDKAAIETRINEAALELYNLQGELDALLREEPVLRAEIFARAEAVKQLVGDYHATLAEGQRIAERLKVFRRNAAAEVQEARYDDMAFRVFRNDALQKYRGAFDLAARYVYLAASAYDYETNLGGGDAQAGENFLTSIVKERGIGQILGGEPLPGSPGLADVMARLKANYDVLKGQMGFNNPQTETNRFSLRRELFRIPPGPEGDAAWREKLRTLRVSNLWAVPEFRRYARPFAPESSGAQPGLVIEFDTDVTFGLNFFGWELGPQDSSYDSSQFATRIRSVGAWFSDYEGLPLADDPRIYLFPVGADVLRAPNADDFATREWQVVDQAIPVPFPIGSTALANYAWNPLQSLSGSATELRRYARFRAYNYTEPFTDAEVTQDSRLVGRSVWNRRWMLIIPGGTFLNDANAGLDTFIDGEAIPGSGLRDGDGVDDIHIFFKTYAYSGR